MSIEFIEDVEIYELGEHLWGQGLSNYKEICEADKEAELEQYLHDIFFEQTPTITEINDLLWHDWETVYDYLGLDEDGEPKMSFEDDGEISDKYLKYLEDNFDGEGSTWLDYSIENVGREVYEQKEGCSHKYDGNYTTMELQFEPPIKMYKLPKDKYNEFMDKLNELERNELSTSGRIITHYDVYIDDSLSYEARQADETNPATYINVKVLGRIIECDINGIYDFMDEVYSTIDEYDEFTEE